MRHGQARFCIAVCGVILATSIAPAIAVEAKQPVLGIDGLGPIKLGSTIPVVERKLRTKPGPLSRNSVAIFLGRDAALNYPEACS
jgi:hypothetical protein